MKEGEGGCYLAEWNNNNRQRFCFFCFAYVLQLKGKGGGVKSGLASVHADGR